MATVMSYYTLIHFALLHLYKSIPLRCKYLSVIDNVEAFASIYCQ